MTSDNTTSYSYLTLADHGATSMTELYIEGVILLIICLVALVGNISVYLIVLRSKKLRTITNFFILGLAAADILVSIGNMPVTVATLFEGNWPLDHTSCLVFGFINMLTLCSSVLSLCNISINRYVMICRPFHSKVIYTKRNAILMIIGVYTLAFVISLPPLFGWAAYAYIPVQSFCFCDWTLAPSYAIFMISCCFGGPFTVMTVCNILIFCSAKKSNRNTKYYTTAKSKKKDAQAKELRLASILLVVVIVFVICWCPYCISMLLSIYAPGFAPRGFHMFTILVGYANSGANPIIYGVMNRAFRNGFKQLYCGWMGVQIDESTGIASNSDEPSGIPRNPTSDSKLSAGEELVNKS
ncbi:octopamine receptor-like [Saccostrea echinata]|uniref:octopamine receptor-like n=1 Tax=Saccostrea echinata TaxID=191078 RepID=UPI002A827274|nr:octopamine receptor-like [Saccostrea echinata]